MLKETRQLIRHVGRRPGDGWAMSDTSITCEMYTGADKTTLALSMSRDGSYEVRILTRAHSQVIGTFVMDCGHGVVNGKGLAAAQDKKDIELVKETYQAIKTYIEGRFESYVRYICS